MNAAPKAGEVARLPTPPAMNPFTRISHRRLCRTAFAVASKKLTSASEASHRRSRSQNPSRPILSIAQSAAVRARPPRSFK